MDPCSKQNCDEEFQNTMEVGTSASFVMSWKYSFFGACSYVKWVII